MLLPISWFYGKIANARNALYERGILHSYPLGARTISIGNITTGGTGKTPLVAHVAEILADAGETVCILTRGYGREKSGRRVLVSDAREVLVDARTGGDEPVELARRLTGKAVVIADADRVSAAKWAKVEFGITAFVLDDGFQHRRAKRDLDIVCIDATNPCGSTGRVLPAGSLREPFKNLDRADAIVVTRTDLVESADDVLDRLKRRNSRAPIFKSRMQIGNVVTLKEFENTEDDGADFRSLRATADGAVRVLAFCALGNPEAFFSQLTTAFDAREFDLSVTRKFPDHHRYTQSDITLLEQQARESSVRAFVTTAKDAVKLQAFEFEIPCFVVEVEMVMDDPDRFRDLVLSA